MQRIIGKILILVVSISLLLSSCGFSVDKTETVARNEWLNKFLKDPTCLPPCWENIVPGKTTIDDASSILSHVSGIKIANNPTVLSGNTRQMDWRFDQSNDGGDVTTDDQGKVISKISLGFYEKLTTEEIISAFGQPTDVLLYDCRSEFGKHTCEVHLIFQETGIALRTGLIDNFGKNMYQVNISPQTEINGIWFFQKINGTYEKVIGRNSFNYPQYFIKWKGYSNYP